MSAKSGEEQLLEFLYACPVGLIECDLVGDIGLMNPHAVPGRQTGSRHRVARQAAADAASHAGSS
ncbi:MAG: hypothetical protein EOO77_26195, partial [Oxalobacteraceae bacterium]